MTDASNEITVLGGGCFWCTEAVFLRLRGVIGVQSGYCGGHVNNPTYEQVCEQNTGHIEVVKVAFDPAQISFDDILTVFFETHDPTTPDRQGNDVGPQYASAIFFQKPEQETIARLHIERLQEHLVSSVVTKLLPKAQFWPAEIYHDNYFERNPNQPYCAFVVSEKVNKFIKRFPDKLKTS
ncbi:peptide-methionine (S)-S-oxide reductase MsrA [Advenella sp. WQ 585]|uniref:Peptide methionine sulfoxide reductase MsrA n=1 Tax=Advenella mandrilli TaxID=2800330 RepID=A0ABS1EGX7_9BURK|nr:peptide-methionine (S)-S-oxide reductase MsrA [Advenella mandrilli]MBK1782281.1 peptide-methionine (S)-S-oxide reductase MsrA [Advenella mandrilli]